MEILKEKIISEIKNSLDGLNNRMEMIKESNFRDRAIEII